MAETRSLRGLPTDAASDSVPANAGQQAILGFTPRRCQKQMRYQVLELIHPVFREYLPCLSRDPKIVPRRRAQYVDRHSLTHKRDRGEIVHFVDPGERHAVEPSDGSASQANSNEILDKGCCNKRSADLQAG